MQYRVSPKHKGASVNVRKAMSGKGYEEIVTTVKDGTIIEGKPATKPEWVKVAGGYIRSELVQEVGNE